MIKGDWVLFVCGLIFGFAFGGLIGNIVRGADAKKAAVAHGCASWVANENGKAVFTWSDE